MTPDSLIQQGESEFHSGKLMSALSTFEQARQTAPEYYKPWLYCGFTYLSLGRFDDALKYLQAAIPLKPTNSTLHDYLGRCWMGLGDNEKALFHFKESARFSPSAVSAKGDTLRVPMFRFKHDLDQLSALDEKQKLDDKAKTCLNAFRTVWDESDHTAQSISVAQSSQHYDSLTFFYENRVHLEPGSRITGGALNPDLDGDALTAQYLLNTPQILVIDDFLCPDALQALRDFCTYSTMWHQERARGYLASVLSEDFACPLLFQISDELKQLLPDVIKSNRLSYAWGFKYDSTLSGVPIHADDAVVNCNLWITDDDANRNPKTGGLIIWDKKPPDTWSYEDYNNLKNVKKIREFLQNEDAQGIRIPHKANRVVIFDSDLFHETDDIDFEEDYLSRRVNITLLYGICRAGRIT